MALDAPSEPAEQQPVRRSPAGKSLNQARSPEAVRWDVARLAATVALITAVVGLVVTIGADARWLAALGGIVSRTGSIPQGVPFATSPTGHWVNSLVLAELIFHGLESIMGDRGLAVANLLAVAGCFSVVALDARAGGARPAGIASAMAVAAIGALTSLAVARVQMFSLVLFPAMVALLRAEARAPSWRIWLALPLLALWSNLHGAALAGLAVLYAYLALQRFRHQPVLTSCIAVGGLVALCVTPAGLSTVDYYHGLLTNVAAQRGVGQWAPLGLSGFDVVLIIAALLLLFRLRHQLPPLWELVVIVGLAVLTVKAARDGVWLLLFLVAPAALKTRVKRGWNGLIPVAAVLALALLAVGIARAPRPSGASHSLVLRALAVAAGRPILADGLPAEQIAMDGGRIWAGNPIDAFSRRVQNQYVDWVDGTPSGRTALSVRAVNVILVTRGSAADRLTALDPGWRIAAADRTGLIYVRKAARSGSRP